MYEQTSQDSPLSGLINQWSMNQSMPQGIDPNMRQFDLGALRGIGSAFRNALVQAAPPLAQLFQYMPNYNAPQQAQQPMQNPLLRLGQPQQGGVTQPAFNLQSPRWGALAQQPQGGLMQGPFAQAFRGLGAGAGGWFGGGPDGRGNSGAGQFTL